LKAFLAVIFIAKVQKNLNVSKKFEAQKNFACEISELLFGLGDTSLK
jgi:hypothetical protein